MALVAAEGGVEVCIALTDGGGVRRELLLTLNVYDSPDVTNPAAYVVFG
jgi:hypothetical protein